MADKTPEQMSNAEAREQLRTRYGVHELGDCIEPGDLQRKLAKLRDEVPVTYGLRYGTLLRIGNVHNPSAIVTLSHGLGDSAHGWQDVAYTLSRRLSHLLFLLPTAPERAVTINGGASMPAWYDIRSMIGDTSGGAAAEAQQDATGVLQSAEYIATLAAVTARRYALGPHRVVYAGFSQGAAVSLVAGLTARVAPAGVVCMSGYLAAAAEVLPRVCNRAVPLALFHGRYDPIVPLDAARRTRDVLRTQAAVTADVELHEYDMQHSACDSEIDDVAAFLSRVLPPLHAAGGDGGSGSAQSEL